METSASPLAASAALAQRVAPSAASASAGPGERFQTLTRWPALIRRTARPLPIAPRPITPTSMAFSNLRGGRHCAERSDEAIQEPQRFLDCFAWLAMTGLVVISQFRPIRPRCVVLNASAYLRP